MVGNPLKSKSLWAPTTLTADAIGVLAFAYVGLEIKMDVITEIGNSLAPWVLAFNVGGFWMWFAIASVLYLSGRKPPKPPNTSRPRRRSKK